MAENMANTEVFSNQKIIISVLLISLLLIIGVFLYHSPTSSRKTILPSDIGFIFPAPREIKPFELLTIHQQKFTLQNFYHHWTLLFFGFTHCATICPTTLTMLDRAYTLYLHEAYPNLQVVFISLDPTRDTVDSLSTYLRTFNPAFIGAIGSLPELRKLQSQLGIFSANEDQSTNNYQIQHTASILLINPAGEETGFFQFGLNPKAFSAAVIKSLKVFS